MGFLEAAWTNPLLFYAILAGFFASIASGIIGSYVVVKRIAFIAGSIAHSVLGGIGFAVWLQSSWFTPLHGALAAAVLSAVLISWIKQHGGQREDTAISAIWTIGMAAGIIFISLTPGFTVELSNYLIGNILWVSKQDLILLLILDFLIVATVLVLHKRLLAICFDEDQARLQGLPVRGLYLLLLILTSITIVLLIQVVGIVLVMTMLTIPAAIANFFTSRLSLMMGFAVLIAAALSFGGTAASYHFDWPAGATIALLAGASYVGCLAFGVKR